MPGWSRLADEKSPGGHPDSQTAKANILLEKVNIIDSF
jgi:hypothetical protein